eukprot:sb/3474002/
MRATALTVASFLSILYISVVICRSGKADDSSLSVSALSISLSLSLSLYLSLSLSLSLQSMDDMTLSSTHSYRSDQGHHGQMVWSSSSSFVFPLASTSEQPDGLQSDPDLVTPDLVTPRFIDRINFPRYRKLTIFDPDLVATPI